MASYVKLDDVTFSDEDLDALFRSWREAIEQANNWSVSGAATFQAGPAGYAMHVGVTAREGMCARVATGGITARVGNTLGHGNAILYTLDGYDMNDGETVEVLNDREDWTGTAGDEIQVKPAYGDKWLIDVAPCIPE